MKKFNNILLIDDDSITNFINSTLIRNVGLGEIIKIVNNGMEALEYIKKECSFYNKYPDLILIDINMPGMDGYEFLKEFRKLKIKDTEKTSVMMLTTSTNQKDKEKADQLGVLMLTKPLRKKMIAELFQETEGI